MDDLAPRPTVTAQDLDRWEANGATWRLFSADEDRILIELCTCTGEPVDVVAAAPDLVRKLGDD